MRSLLLAAALLAVGLAGCLDAPPAMEAPAVPDPAPAAEPFALYLTGAPGLTPEAPTGSEPERVRGGSFFLNWGKREAYAVFLGEPMPETRIVRGNLTFTVYAEAEGAAAQAGIFPHLIAYFGTEEALSADGSADAAPVLAPGDQAEWTGTLGLPRDGLLIPKGVRPKVLLSVVMTQDDRSGDVAFLVNATGAASRVEGTWEATADPPATGEEAQESLEGRLVGSAYAGAREGLSQVRHAWTIPAGTARAVVELETGTAAGFADLDLAVVDAAGKEVVRSVAPLGLERIVLHPHQLPAAGGAFEVWVTNYGSAAATYRLTLTTAPSA
ncbi:MAG TPA: hypothetical protein VNZ52_12830 [Candidatus Thermoplasmatota archaeon]|nr:hypothetical protein [Candidatus Thermoplasmatota archaeon]